MESNLSLDQNFPKCVDQDGKPYHNAIRLPNGTRYCPDCGGMWFDS